MGLWFFEWCEATLIGETVRTSVWLFPIIEATHLLGLSLLGGAVLMLDLRMLGLLLPRVRIDELARLARPWQWRGVAIMLATGIPLFLSEAVKCYYSPAFWVKMVSLPIAIGFAATVRRGVAARPGLVTSWSTRAVGATSMALWFVVAAAGRWIGLS